MANDSRDDPLPAEYLAALVRRRPQHIEAPVRLGLMPPLTGVVGMYGEEIARAAQIACAEVNEAGGVLGRPLELVIEDDGSLPESAVAAAERLAARHRCAALIGNLLSNARIAVAYRVAEPRRIPYLNFSFYEGSILSRYFFHFAALPNQQIERMIPFMREKYGPRMYFAGNAYEWPRGSIDAARRALAVAGGTAVGEEYLPLGVAAADIEALLDRVEAAAPDVFVPYFAGADQLALLERFAARGLKRRIAVVMGHYDEVMASRLSPQVREGLYSSNTYFMGVDTPQNRQVLSRLAAWPGVAGLWPAGDGLLTNFGEGAYLCVKAFATAAHHAGSLNAEALVEALATVTLAGPQGFVGMDAATHHARVNTYLARCRFDGGFDLVENFGAIAPSLPERYRHLQFRTAAAAEDDIRLQARMLEQLSEAVLLVRSDDQAIVYANHGAECLFGWGRDELIGKSLVDFRGADAAGRRETLVHKGCWQGEIRHRRKDGSEVWTAASKSAFTHPVHGEVWLAVYRDISAIKALQDALEGQLELRRHVEDLSRFNRLAVGRELRMIELKREIDALCAELGQPPRYARAAAAEERERGAQVLPESEQHSAAALEVANVELSASRAAALNLMEDADIARRDTERSNAELIAARDEAQRVARVKSVFLAHMSHEIRTPLHIVIGLGHLLRRDLAAPAQCARLEQLCATSDHLLALVNDILDLSKIEAGRLTLDPGDFALAEVADKVMRMVAESAREKGLTLTADIAPAVRALRLRGDPLRLAQVLLNLCGNAVKFTERGGVRLAIERVGEDVAGVALRFAVEDTGIGVAPADQTRLFQPFAQADSSATRAHGGSGLGLAISQHLVTLMGGTIRLDSRSGAGSRFEFDLVLPHAAAAADGDATEFAEPGEAAGRWVLLVEDHPLSQDILFEMLTDLGCEVDVASDGIEAVSCAQVHRYDLILMDMQMPRLDGLAATGAIRALPQHRHTPILALTANAFAEDRRRCLDAGMNDHIAKPVTPLALAAALRRWIPDAAGPAAGAPAAEAELPAGLADVAGLEVPSAMRRSPQTLAEYGTLLERFVAMHGEDMARLRRHLAADEREAAHTLAHNLKGIAGLLGAKRIAALAHDIVQGLRADSAPIDLEPLAAECESALARLAQAVAALPQGQGGTADEAPAADAASVETPRSRRPSGT